MECSNCGANRDDDAGFCPNCGASTSAAVDPLAEEAFVVSRPEDALARHGYELASIWRRFFARLIDGLIIGVVLLLILAASGTDFSDDSVGFGTNALLLIAAAAYEIGMVSSRGQTVGKIWLGIKVVRIEDRGIHPPPGRAMMRYALPNVLGLLGFLGTLLSLLVYLSAIWDGQKQGWHDKAAKTVVIKL